MDAESENPSVEIAEIVAELEEKDVIEVTTIWECVDGMLAEMFANPPSPEAQLEVTFSYEGYGVTVEQNGSTKFIKTDRATAMKNETASARFSPNQTRPVDGSHSLFECLDYL